MNIKVGIGQGGIAQSVLLRLKDIYRQRMGASPESLDILLDLANSAFYWRDPVWVWRHIRELAAGAGVESVEAPVIPEIAEVLSPVVEEMGDFLKLSQVDAVPTVCGHEVSEFLAKPSSYLCLKRKGELKRSRLFVINALRSGSLPFCELSAWVLMDILRREDVPEVEKVFVALRLYGYDLSADGVLSVLNTQWAERRSYLRRLRKIATRLTGLVRESLTSKDFEGLFPVRVLGFLMFGGVVDLDAYRDIKRMLSFYPLVDAILSIVYPEDLSFEYVRRFDFEEAFSDSYPFELAKFIWWLIEGPPEEELLSVQPTALSPGQKAALAMVMQSVKMETLARSILADVQGKSAYWLDNALVSIARYVVFGEGEPTAGEGVFELVKEMAFSPTAVSDAELRKVLLLPLIFALVEGRLADNESDEKRKRELLRDEHDFFVIRDYSDKVREIEKRLRDITPDDPAKWIALYHDMDDRVLSYQSMLDMFLTIDMSDLPKMVRSIAEEYYRFTLADYLVFAVLSGENLSFYWHLAPPQVENIHFRLDKYLAYPAGYHFTDNGDLVCVHKGRRLTIVVFAAGADRGARVPSNIASAIYMSLPLLEALIEGGQYRQMSMRDHLTGLYSRWYLVERLEEEFERARIAGSEFSLLYIDVDNFKMVNDVYGHIEGDRVLAILGNLFLSSLREVDIVARYGGEEFVVLLPETSLAGACKVAHRLRANVERRFKDLYGVTISIGVVHYPSFPASSWEDIIREADRLMYIAKAKGKNRVECYRPPEP